jgi:hypothetical protein
MGPANVAKTIANPRTELVSIFAPLRQQTLTFR